MSQYTSTTLRISIKAATVDSALHAALDVALQQQQEGQREMQNDQNHGHHPQPPNARVMYQGISSLILPDQMIRNCENDR